jgi:hypothetical protein
MSRHNYGAVPLYQQPTPGCQVINTVQLYETKVKQLILIQDRGRRRLKTSEEW